MLLTVRESPLKEEERIVEYEEVFGEAAFGLSERNRELIAHAREKDRRAPSAWIREGESRGGLSIRCRSRNRDANGCYEWASLLMLQS